VVVSLRFGVTKIKLLVQNAKLYGSVPMRMPLAWNTVNMQISAEELLLQENVKTVFARIPGCPSPST